VILHRGSPLKLPELVQFLMEQEIAKHKLPERLEIVEEFPLSPVGKVSKRDLTERITERLKAEGKI
jgi:2,3-dihydroxybenzoate-AMP ligase